MESSSIITGLIAASVALVVAFLTQFVAEKFKRFHDGSAVAAGLAGELSAYKDALFHLMIALKAWSELEVGHEKLILRPIDKPVDLFYASAVGKIGVLGSDLAEDIVYVYASIDGFRTGFDVLTKSFKEMESGEFRTRAASCHLILSQAPAAR